MEKYNAFDQEEEKPVDPGVGKTVWEKTENGVGVWEKRCGKNKKGVGWIFAKGWEKNNKGGGIKFYRGVGENLRGVG